MQRLQAGLPSKDYRIVIFEGVAQYIREKWQNGGTSDLASIASEVFPNGATERTEQLRLSIESYGPQGLLKSAPNTPSPEEPAAQGLLKSAPNTPRPEEPAAQRLENGGTLISVTADVNWQAILSKARKLREGGCIAVFNVLNGICVKRGSTMEDFWNDDLPLAASILLPLRERTYGILLQEKPGGPGNVEEYYVYGPCIPEESSIWRKPVLPPQELHPGLLALWGYSPDYVGDIEETRWKLFAHTVSRNLNAEHLRNLAIEGFPHLVVPTVVLRYMREAIPRCATEESSQYLIDREVEAMAIQAALMKSTSDPSRLIIPTPYNVRAIRLAGLFMKCVSRMLGLLETCGCPIPMAEAMPWLYFDGKLFHQTYVARMNGESVESLCRNQDGESVLEDFLKMRNIILGPV